MAPQGPIYSNAWSSVSEPVWKEFGCEALLEKMCHWGSVRSFKSLCHIQCFTTVCASGSVGNSQLLCQHHACLPAAMFPAILVVEASGTFWNSELSNQTFSFFFLMSCLVMVFHHSSGKVNKAVSTHYMALAFPEDK